MIPVQNTANSIMVSTLDLAEPEYLNKIFRRYHGQGGQTYLLINSLGFDRPVESDEYHHFEEDHYDDYIVVKSIAGAGVAGAASSFLLDPSKYDSDRKYYPQVNNVVMFSNRVIAWITDVTDAGIGGDITITVKPHDESEAIPALAAGEKIAIISNTWNEASSVPEPLVVGATKFSNEAMIIKEAISSTGTQLVTKTWIDQYNKAGEFQGKWHEDMLAIDYRMIKNIEGAFTWSKRIDTTGGRAVDADGYNKKATEGLVPSIATYGHTNKYNEGFFAVTKFDEYARTLQSEYVDTNNPIWAPFGLYLYQECENVLKTYFADTNINYCQKTVNDALFKGNEALGASVNFKYLQKSDYTFLFQNLQSFNDPTTTGITDFKIRNMGMLIPLGIRKDPKTKNDIPTIGMRYRAMGRYNRKFIVGSLVGFGSQMEGEQFQDTYDKRTEYMMTHRGAEFFGLNSMILIETT